MNAEYFISLVLDTRRAKKRGLYPVKLRIFTPYPREQKLYPVDIDLSEKDFKSIWETTKTRQQFKDQRAELQAIESRAFEVAKKLEVFSFENFESLYFKKHASADKDLNYYYQKAIDQFNLNKQVGTATNYEYSLKSLVSFAGKEKIQFRVITPQFLKDYERNMIDEKKRSLTTIGMYLRPLRAVFNTAIIDNIISIDAYPFGKRKYTIPSPKGVKKALSKEQLKMLFEAKPLTPEQAKAKDFWFFSYSCNGMNFKDISNLQYKNISGDTMTFIRAKTGNTNRKQSPVICYLNDFTRDVITSYGNLEKSPDNFIFEFINRSSSPLEQMKQLQNFIRFVNQHFSILAKSKGIENVSTYYARHSFATQAIRNGASMEYVSEALSHSSLNTTKAYFAGFEDEHKKEIALKLMMF